MNPASSKPRVPRFAKRALIIAGVIIILAAVISAAVIVGGRAFTAQEKAVRSDWATASGELIGTVETTDVEVRRADVESELKIASLVPTDIQDEGFTYYDERVQGRIADALGKLKDCGINWTAENPLAVLNPFGTGSNGLYLYFSTDYKTQVAYTVRTPDLQAQEWRATAKNAFLEQPDEEDLGDFSYEHELQIIGLVPGTTNEVTLTVTGEAGTVRQKVTFSIDMPQTQSGYPTQLDYTDGESVQELSSGLYALVRTNGYLGYGFFFDNSGTMRYEMVTEGFGLDRILEYDGSIVVCASAQSLARIDGLGRVVQVYDLGGYELHHDIVYGDEDTVVALAEIPGRESVEDVVIEVDLASGQVSELVDFTSLMDDYVSAYTRPIGAGDALFWQAGERDWIHLNTVQYLTDQDALIVSSRETSTIIRVDGAHESPRISWLIGNEAFWEGTPYEGLSLARKGDFAPQYGQHSVEYDGEGPTEGSYYLLMFDNNYWSLSTRDGFAPDLAGTDASEDMYSGETSHVYRYLVDEKAGTYELAKSFDVPYSSIVSNAAHTPDSANYVVNSGMAHVFGEYDQDGQLIRQFAYECTLQGYRAFKCDFENLWFAG